VASAGRRDLQRRRRPQVSELADVPNFVVSAFLPLDIFG